MKQFDLIIIGAGPVGLAAAYFSAKEGLRVLVVEQYQLLHQLSSSSGATRQFRLQYSEEYMATLCLQTLPFWEELQLETKEVLRSKVGSLWFGIGESNSSEGEIGEAIKTMDKLGISYDKLDKRDIESSFQFKNLPQDYVGLFQNDGGTINVLATINVLKRLCDTTGKVDFAFESEVREIVTRGSISVTTKDRTFYSSKVLLCAGPYSNRLLKKSTLTLRFNIWQMVSAYFKLKDPAKDLPSWFVYERIIPEDQEGFYYGFENCHWDHPGYLRIAPAYATDKFTDPIYRKPEANQKDLQLTVDWVKKRLSFVDPSPTYVSTCLASIPLAAEKKMYLDFQRKEEDVNKNIVVFSSGWAFKFVPLLGKICSELIIKGKSTYDIRHFGMLDDQHLKTFTPKPKRRLPF